MVPDSATKYTEATGGLQSDMPFEAPMMESPGVGHCRRLKWISLPHPLLFVSVSEYHLDRFSFILV